MERRFLRFTVVDLKVSVGSVQNTVKLFVQDHLRQLLLHHLHGKLDQFGNVNNLDTAKRLDDSEKILFQEIVVKLRQMIVNNGIIDDLFLN